MAAVRIALASTPLVHTVDGGVRATVDAVAEAARRGALVVCFPEAAIPGHRLQREPVEDATAGQLAAAAGAVAAAARSAGIAVIAGIEEVDERGRLLSCTVFGPDGAVLGRQRKVQVAPEEDRHYVGGSGRSIFEVGPLTFGISICHEAFRYPETVRWAATRGATVVFHPHYVTAEPGSVPPTTWCSPGNSYHERAVSCRALENTIYVASCNVAGPDQGSATCVVDPDGNLVDRLPYGGAGLLVVDVELDRATGLLARRLRPTG
jgi:predicted amidohydrolase